MQSQGTANVGATERQVEEAAIIARANKLLAGAPLKFGEAAMNNALAAFVSFLKVSERYQGNEADYLRKNPVSDILGVPTCGSCDEEFKSDRSWARHQMSYGHMLMKHWASHEAVLELRAHLHAFPAPEEEWFSQDPRRIQGAYNFRNLPPEDIKDPRAHGEMSKALLDEILFGITSSNAAELKERLASPEDAKRIAAHVRSLLGGRARSAEPSLDEHFDARRFEFLERPQLVDTMLVGISRYFLNDGDNPWFETLPPGRRATAKARINTLRTRLEEGFSAFSEQRLVSTRSA